MLGRGFTSAEVSALDAAIDGAEERATADAPSEPETPGEPRKVSGAGRALIRQFEGCVRLLADGILEAYPDPGTGGAPWTIGWGATGSDVKPGTVWSQAQCDARLDADIEWRAAEVRTALGSALARTSQAQFNALVSFL